MSLMEAGWDWLHLWPRNPCSSPSVCLGTHHTSHLEGSCQAASVALLGC